MSEQAGKECVGTPLDADRIDPRALPLQPHPEHPRGLGRVSVAALNAGLHKLFYAAFTGIRAGLVEIPLALFGAWAVQLAQPLLPYAMGFAAGAMIYVISDAIIPETHAKGHERTATLGLMLGVIVMLYLDVSLA